jgi:hypothetical protein
VLLDSIDAANQQITRTCSTLPRYLVFTCDYDNVIVFLILRMIFLDSICFAYSTSGASETIFMNFSVRNSRVTGPKMRVPIGSSLALTKPQRYHQI